MNPAEFGKLLPADAGQQCQVVIPLVMNTGVHRLRHLHAKVQLGIRLPDSRDDQQPGIPASAYLRVNVAPLA